MLRRVVAFAVVALLGAVCASAEPVCNSDANDLSWLLPAPEVTVDPAGVALAEAAGRGVPQRTVTCTADCQNGTSVSCTASTNCSAIQRDCSVGERGHVTCNGVTTTCGNTCPANCTNLQCKQPCKVPGCAAVCLSLFTCECESVCF